MPQITTAPIDNAIVVAFQLRKPGMRRAVDRSQFILDADPEMIHVSQDIVDSPEYRAIAAWDRQMDQLMTEWGLPFPITFVHNLWLWPTVRKDDLDAAVAKFLARRGELIEIFLEAWPRLIRESPQKLRAAFNPEHYPNASTLKGAFGCQLEYLQLTFTPALQEAAEARVWDTLRDQLRTLITNDAGQPKAVRGALLEHVQEFLNVFQARNLFNAQDLAGVVARCAAVIEGLDATSLKGNVPLQETVQAGLAQVQAQLDALTNPTRKLRLAPVDAD